MLPGHWQLNTVPDTGVAGLRLAHPKVVPGGLARSLGLFWKQRRVVGRFVYGRFCSRAVTKYRKVGGSNNRKLLSHNSGVY